MIYQNGNARTPLIQVLRQPNLKQKAKLQDKKAFALHKNKVDMSNMDLVAANSCISPSITKSSNKNGGSINNFGLHKTQQSKAMIDSATGVHKMPYDNMHFDMTSGISSKHSGGNQQQLKNKKWNELCQT